MKIRLGNSGSGSHSDPGIRGSKRLGWGGKMAGTLFGLPFFLLGSFFCWIGGLQPVFKVIESGSWPEVPCVITHSKVSTNTGGDSTTYAIDIDFRYTYGERQYVGGNYDFSSGSSSGYEGKARVVRNHPVGRVLTCRVNPADPEEAILSRRIPIVVFFVVPFSSIFILVGLAIILGSLGLLPEKWKMRVASRHKPVTTLDAGETKLEPGLGGKGKVLGALFGACIWNGIVGVFLWQVVQSFIRGNPEWFLVLFLVPFVAVGIFLVFLVFYYLLALANPTFSLILSEGSPRLGDTVRLRWEASGSVSRLNSLVFQLEGYESATYRRGTRSVTDHSVFFREIIHESRQHNPMPGGALTVTIPVTAMHSFEGGNNRIGWRFRVKGSIHRWPDVNEVYPVTIRPIRLS